MNKKLKCQSSDPVTFKDGEKKRKTNLRPREVKYFFQESTVIDIPKSISNISWSISIQPLLSARAKHTVFFFFSSKARILGDIVCHKEKDFWYLSSVSPWAICYGSLGFRFLILKKRKRKKKNGDSNNKIFNVPK